jgi:hypothetical protein
MTAGTLSGDTRASGAGDASAPRVRVTLSDDARSGLGNRTVMARHDLHESPLFSDESLAQILDGYPPEKLFALTMGSDPERSEDNERLQHTGVSGAGLLEAVRKGRMWLNITAIDTVDSRFRALTDELYAQVAAQVPGFAGIETHATLLVSSPDAMVYYHVDGPPSFLWHIRGRKRVWVYPALDEDLLPRRLLEDVFAGVRQEYVPYRHAFDQQAEVFDLEPGECAMWVQNAPHRITNHDSLNVSLVTDHYTIDARRRARVYTANRFLRAKAHVPPRLLSTTEHGPVASAKVAVHRVGRKLGLDDPMRKAHRPSVRRVDPSAPNGMSPIDGGPAA